MKTRRQRNGADWQGLKEPYQEELTPSMGDQGRVSPTHHATRLRLDCLDLHYSKPKGEPVSEERYN